MKKYVAIWGLVVPLFCVAAPLQHFTEALALIQLEDAGYRKLGWVTLAKVLKDVPNSELSQERTAKFETAALQDYSFESLVALKALYTASPSLRLLRLIETENDNRPEMDAPEAMARFYVAALAQAENPIRFNELVPWEGEPLSDDRLMKNQRRLLSRLLIHGVDGIEQKLFTKDQVVHHFFMKTSTWHAPTAALMFDLLPPDVSKNIIGERYEQYISDGLGRCTAIPPPGIPSAIRNLARVSAEACTKRLNAKARNEFQTFSLSSLSEKLEAFDGSTEPPQVKPLELDIQFDNDSMVQNGAVTLKPEKALYYGTHPHNREPEVVEKYRRGEFESFRESKASEFMMDFDNICTWTPSRKIICPLDTVDIPVINLGMQSHFQTLEGGNVKINATLRTALIPTPETNWIAVRWVSNGSGDTYLEKPGPISPTNVPKGKYVFPEADVVCTTGCLWKQSLIKEPGSGWQIFSVIPNAPVQFTVKFAPPQGLVRRPIEHGIAGTGSTHLQYFEMNSASLAQFPHMDVRDVFAKVPDFRPVNGLLTYVAAVQRELNGGGWLRPASSPETALSLVLARLSLLQKVAEFQPNGEEKVLEDSLIAWKERQLFLKRAMGSLIIRTIVSYKNSMETVISRTIALDLMLQPVHKRLFDALEANEALTAESAYALLGYAAKSLRIENPAIIRNKERLVSALYGAEQQLSGVSEKLKEQSFMGCLLAQRLVVPAHRLVPPSELDPQIAQMCSEIR